MIMHRPDPAAAIRSLRSAAPYIRMYKGKTFVVKAGGGVFADPAAVRGLIEQIAILHYFGVRVVFVHGGGPQLTEITEALGVPTRMVQGRRVTDQKAIDATSMVLNGLINTKLLALCREMNIDAIGVSGVDAGLIKRAQTRAGQNRHRRDGGLRLRRRHRRHRHQRPQQAARQWPHAHRQPPVGRRQRHACSTSTPTPWPPPSAPRMSAEKLMLCTGAPGILERVEDPSSIISYTDLAGLKRLREEKKIIDGMLPKAKAIEDAIRGGVRRVHVMSYKSPEGILAEVFTNEGAGTLIVADVNALSAAEQQSGN